MTVNLVAEAGSAKSVRNEHVHLFRFCFLLLFFLLICFLLIRF